MNSTRDMLLDRWIGLCGKLRLHGDCAGAGSDILRRYSEPHRRYHDRGHLADCLRVFDLHAAQAEDPVAVEMALWFHDAIYTVRAADNEERSADLAQQILSGLGTSSEFIDSVRAAIIATKHKVEPPPGDAELVCDIDLSILGSPPDRYDRYAAGILAESGLGMEAFRPLRLAFLEAMLARPPVFHTATFRRELEEAARQNMVREREELDMEGDKTEDLLLDVIEEQPYPLLFVTISGAHLYGFPSPDSDFDLRGVHVLPAAEVLGLGPFHETIERGGIREGREIDLVTHDVKKFFSLMLKKNGYVLEQLYSPLVVQTSPEHEELKAIGAGCITRYHVYHYLGFADTQWKLLTRESPPRVKPLLYVYRVLFTGIHLMRTGQVEANLLQLNEVFRHPAIADLVARKLEGPERGTLPEAEMQYHQAEYNRLRTELEEAGRTSTLPEAATARAALNDLLVRVRMRPRTEAGQ